MPNIIKSFLRKKRFGSVEKKTRWYIQGNIVLKWIIKWNIFSKELKVVWIFLRTKTLTSHGIS